jgi:hypothetical protein
MTRKIFYFIYVLFFASINNQLLAQSLDKSNALYKESRNWPRYIILTTDTAYYERRQFDKHDYFTDIDTLVKNLDCDCYNGKSTSLKINNSVLILSYNKGRDSLKKHLFIIANDKALKEWTGNKNIDKLRTYDKKLTDILFSGKLESKRYKMFKSEWYKLGDLALILNQKEFDVQLEFFLAKYLIK